MSAVVEVGPRIDVRILGPVTLAVGGEQRPLGSPKQRAVFAALAMAAGQVVSTDRLLVEVWGPDAPESALSTLQVYVSRLRRVLGEDSASNDGSSRPRILRRPPGYVLDVPLDAVDAHRLGQRVGEARALLQDQPQQALRLVDDALALVTGTPLVDVLGSLGPAAAAEAARLEELVLLARQVRVSALLESGDAVVAAGEAGVLVSQHPLREDLHGLRMLALYRTGRQSEALVAYDSARRLLADELGIDPGAALRRLHAQVLEHDPALEPPSRAVEAPTVLAPAQRSADGASGRVRLVVAEDDLLTREGLRSLLAASGEVELLEVCGDYDELLAAVDALAPDVVLTDIRMPPTGTDEGVRAADRLRRTHPLTGVVVLSQFGDPEFAIALLDKGSEGRGYLLKERMSDPTQLVSALHEVARGGSVIDPKVVDALVHGRSASRGLAALTHVERDVLARMAEGHDNAGIALIMSLPVDVVERHVEAIFAALALGEEAEGHRRVKAVLLHLGAM